MKYQRFNKKCDTSTEILTFSMPIRENCDTSIEILRILISWAQKRAPRRIRARGPNGALRISPVRIALRTEATRSTERKRLSPSRNRRMLLQKRKKYGRRRRRHNWLSTDTADRRHHDLRMGRRPSSADRTKHKRHQVADEQPSKDIQAKPRSGGRSSGPGAGLRWMPDTCFFRPRSFERRPATTSYCLITCGQASP